MPYVTATVRARLDSGEREPDTIGELTYTLCRQVDTFLQRNGGAHFAELAEVVAALECAKLEVYRRVGAPHEDDALARNGEVFTGWQAEASAR